VSRLDPGAAVDTDLWRDNFTGLRTCLELARSRNHTGPVKWHFVGPISVGLALRRAGADADVAFSMAARVVRSHLEALSAEIAASLPDSPQLVVLDEPFLDDLMSRDFPIAPEEAVDLLSSAMAAVEHGATVGVHACCKVDIATLMASGPKVLSLPAREDLVPYAGYLARFVRNGGWIMWGAVPTEGPIGSSPGRAAGRLEALWCELAQRGCDPILLREQSLISPQCGLGGHSTSVGERVCTTLRGVSRAIRSA
jgi:methionine synthase II (cobalamin-independent)